ncbi:FO synthase [Gordonia otitidis]|uniref:FO synthase n=1 Tax=Gordonia otitidis TaxID=249058 RepID=UPI001D143A9E|nr:FO synthase [Gordonia otitidis]UEA58400.1 FO synthase [Gordonia otitidis]
MVLRAWASDRPAPGGSVRSALAALRTDRTSLTDADWAALLGADGDELTELCTLADVARREATEPDVMTFVVNRNLDTAVVAAPQADVSIDDLVAEAWALGATEICMQGPLPRSRDDVDPDAYLSIIRRIRAAAPGMHLHAFRPPEIVDAASRMGIDVAEFLRRARDAGLGSVPGTAAQILDDEVRAALHPVGTPPPVSEWVDTIRAAHDAHLFSTATLLYGHVETAGHVVAHLRLLNRIADETGGFHELIVMPLLPQNAPPHLADVATAEVSRRETRAVHAVARLMTVGHIDHLQVAWTKLDRDVVLEVLSGGADDLGGLLLDGELSPESGQEAGRTLTVDDVIAIADAVGRVPRQRRTDYGDPPPGQRTVLPQNENAQACG